MNSFLWMQKREEWFLSIVGLFGMEMSVWGPLPIDSDTPSNNFILQQVVFYFCGRSTLNIAYTYTPSFSFPSSKHITFPSYTKKYGKIILQRSQAIVPTSCIQQFICQICFILVLCQICRHLQWVYFIEPQQLQMLRRGFIGEWVDQKQILHFVMMLSVRFQCYYFFDCLGEDVENVGIVSIMDGSPTLLSANIINVISIVPILIESPTLTTQFSLSTNIFHTRSPQFPPSPTKTNPDNPSSSTRYNNRSQFLFLFFSGKITYNFSPQIPKQQGVTNYCC